ncbi:MAG: HEAT repeat domain-containing protein [Kiritimatiellae bacterium]|nr:HEAT repeat domain-containing protein [Kiritimatiellia bacterium]
MSRYRFVVLVLVVTCFGGVCCSGSTNLNGIAELVEQSAEMGPGISDKEDEVAEHIWSLGPDAIPFLLRLLKHDNEDVRDLASYIVRSIEGLGEEHLDALIESRLRGDGWIPPAIAGIGTPKAIRFLVDELRKEKQRSTQLTVAFENLGEKAIPYLLGLYKDTQPYDGDLFSVVDSILKDLGHKVEGAIDPLINIASDQQIDRRKRRAAVDALGSMGPLAKRSVPVLQELARTDPETFSNAVEMAIIEMRVPEAARILTRHLETHTDVFRPAVTIYWIASLKANGRSAGPTLIRYLADDDWELRVLAATALGHIGYAEASGALLRQLEGEQDWRLVYASAESLGRLHVKDAIPALERLSKSHWYPPVRTASAKAINVMNGKSAYESETRLDFYVYGNVKRFGHGLAANTDRGNTQTFVGPEAYLTASELEELAYEGPIGDGRDGRIRKQIPGVGLKVENGYLVGADRGEFMGELVFVTASGKKQTLMRENIEGIHRMPCGIVATTGLCHMGTDEGILYKIAMDKSRDWHATKWKALPGDPLSSLLLKDGSLLVLCTGGMIVVTPDGNIRMASDRRDMPSVLDWIVRRLHARREVQELILGEREHPFLLDFSADVDGNEIVIGLSCAPPPAHKAKEMLTAILYATEEAEMAIDEELGCLQSFEPKVPFPSYRYELSGPGLEVPAIKAGLEKAFGSPVTKTREQPQEPRPDPATKK